MELGVDTIRRVSRLSQDDPVDQRAPVKPDYVLSATVSRLELAALPRWLFIALATAATSSM